MNLNPTTWKPAALAGTLLTVIVLVAIAHPLIKIGNQFLDFLDGVIPVWGK